MNAKQYLKQLKWLKNLIDTKQGQIQSLRDMTTRITPNSSSEPVQTSGVSDKIGNSIAKIVDLEGELTTDIHKYTVLMQEILHRIELLPDNELKVLLAYKYVNFNTWEQIAEKMECSLRWVYELHQRALSAFEVVLKLS